MTWFYYCPSPVERLHFLVLFSRFIILYVILFQVSHSSRVYLILPYLSFHYLSFHSCRLPLYQFYLRYDSALYYLTRVLHARRPPSIQPVLEFFFLLRPGFFRSLTLLLVTDQRGGDYPP